MGILTQHMYKAPVPILAMVPPPQGVPPGLDAIIQKCLSKKPEQRYGTMAALTADLEKVEQGVVPDAVPEMMSRSGGFNVPADYFRSGTGMPAPVPATPLAGPRPRWGVYAGITSVVACVSVALFAMLRPSPSHATSPASIEAPGTSPSSAPIVADTPRASSSSAVAAGASAIAAPEAREVIISVEPSDAKVTRDGSDLGALPTSLRIAPGTSVALLVTRAGFKAQTITLDGSQPRMLVKMERVATKPAKLPSAKASQSGTSAVGEFQDPFLKK
jgi:hypothetical protein